MNCRLAIQPAWQTLPLILLPGMGADDRLFAPQRAAFPNLRVPKWIEPTERESLASYGRRFAEAVDPGGPCFIGGASFGGFVAVEMARHLQARACFLIGSARSPEELPEHIRSLSAVAAATRVIPWPWIMKLAGCGADVCGALSGPVAQSILRQFAECDARFLRWAMRAVLTWQAGGGDESVPMLQVHGDRDSILPCRVMRPDRLIRGAGHGLSLTHGEQVNTFLREGMEGFAGRAETE